MYINIAGRGFRFSSLPPKNKAQYEADDGSNTKQTTRQERKADQVVEANACKNRNERGDRSGADRNGDIAPSLSTRRLFALTEVHKLQPLQEICYFRWGFGNDSLPTRNYEAGSVIFLIHFSISKTF